MRSTPSCLNFFITAEVLSWVITCRGRMDTKSSCRIGRDWGSAKWRSVSFSTMVWPISPFLSTCRSQELHEIRNRGQRIHVPNRLFHPLHGRSIQYGRGQCLELLLDL